MFFMFDVILPGLPIFGGAMGADCGIMRPIIQFLGVSLMLVCSINVREAGGKLGS